MAGRGFFYGSYVANTLISPGSIKTGQVKRSESKVSVIQSLIWINMDGSYLVYVLIVDGFLLVI